MFMTSLLTITPWPVLSAAILLVLLIAALYLARHTAHQAIHAVTSALARGFRLASHSVAHAEERLAARNREVLLAAGRDAKERMVEREFARIADTTRKDLSNYPDMHRRLSEAIIRIEEDQEKAVEVPPEAPGWAKAVEVIAKLDARNAGAEILADIHKSMLKAHAEAMVDYRKASGERHGLLRKMMPDWRLIQETLGRVNKSVASVIERSLVIDRHMQDYETIVHGEDRALSVLSSSSLVHFFVSMLVLPVIGALSDKMRVRMIGITFAILLLMASIEAGLAYMREVLLQDELATNALLRSDSTGALVNAHLWITTMAQMGMGFILPFALVFAAIPLETFVHSLRTVLGLMGIGVLRALALILRVLGNGLRHLGTLAERIYDLPLFVPLWIEARFAAAHALPPAIEDESLQEVRP
ncbi:MAG: hypothetical protein E6K34_10340 [Gammaproteobacteria bacterium]|nr:MAG: hypothetical protein E6K34_10340 [Gammaproteobacteria bacterium]